MKNIREELIKLRRKLKIENGYLKLAKSKKVKDEGGILEFTGKLLIACNLNIKERKNDKLKNYIETLTDGLYQNFHSFIIPRTIYIGTENPNLTESEPNRWEIFRSTGVFEGVEEMIIWYRTDMSHAQMFYILLALSVCFNGLCQKAEIFKMMNDMFIDLKRDNWIVQRFDGKPASNGNFNVYWKFGTPALRRLTLCELEGIKLKKFDSIMLHLNKLIIAFLIPFKKDSSNGFNAMICLYYLNFRKKKALDFMKEYSKSLDIDNKDESKDLIEWLMIQSLEEK